MGCAVVAVLIASSVALVNRGGGDAVQVRGASRPALADATPTTAEQSTTTVAPTTISTPDRQLPPGTVPTAPVSPWQVSPTTGLVNLAPVTMTATGLAPGTYYAGQCPAGEAPSLDSCVLNQVVTVTGDGALSGTVHVFWWLRGGRIDCGRAPGACAVGVMNARTAVTVASFPISFDTTRPPVITVTPHDSLRDGQSVSVHGVDIGEGTVQIEECLLPLWGCTYAHLSSGPDGTFTTAITVSRSIEWYGRAGPESGVCGVDGDCVIEVYIVPKGFDSKQIWINPDQPVALEFAPVPSTSPTTATTLPPGPAG